MIFCLPSISVQLRKSLSLLAAEQKTGRLRRRTRMVRSGHLAPFTATSVPVGGHLKVERNLFLIPLKVKSRNISHHLKNNLLHI